MKVNHLLIMGAVAFCSLTASAQSFKPTAQIFRTHTDASGKAVQIAVPVEESLLQAFVPAVDVAEQSNLPMTMEMVNGVLISRHMTTEEARQYELRSSRRAEAENNKIFVAYTDEGLAMTFKVLSEEDKTCQVGVGEGNSTSTNDAAIERTYDGVVTIPAEAKGYKVIQLGNGAFYSCSKMKAVNIPNTIKRINFCAFQYCQSLTSLYIPASVEEIHEWIANGTNAMEVIEVDPSNPVFDSRDNCNAIIKTSNISIVRGCKTTKIFEGVNEIATGAFSGCAPLTSLNIPSTVSRIGGQAFQDCYNLASITVDSDNKYFDSRNNCNAVVLTADNQLCVGAQNTVIPASVTSIRYYAFAGRHNIPEIVIPKSIVSIGYNAFYDCSDTKKVISRIHVPFDVDEYTFSGIYDYATLYVPQGTKTDYQSKVGWGKFKTIVELDENDNPVEDETEFEAPTVEGVMMKFKVLDANMKTCQAGLIVSSSSSSSTDACVPTNTTGTITIPSEVKGYKVTRIAQSAFYGVYNATKINIPNTVESIGDFAFAACNNMHEIYLPASVTRLSSYALAHATGRTTIVVDANNPVYDSRNNCNAVIEKATNNLVFGCATTNIPESVEQIGQGAFYGCSDAKSFSIPKNVRSFGSQSFSYCYYLETLNVDEANPLFDSRDNCGGVVETATNTMVKMGGKSTLPKSLTAIGWHALEGNSIIEKLEIPAGVKSISSSSFYYCSKLYQVISLIKKPFEIADNAITTGYQKYPEFLYVPAGTKSLYKETPSWNLFTNIEELGSETTVEIDPLPENATDFNGMTGDEDLSNTEVDNILFTLDSGNGDGYDPTAGCIVVNTTMTQDQIDALDMSQVGTPEFAEMFTGMVIAIQAGRGTITVDMQSLGNHGLGVKIGGGASVKLTHAGRDVIVINYNVAEDTYVLLYAIDVNGSAAPLRASSVGENCLKIYAIAWNHLGGYDPTLGIENVENSKVNNQSAAYTLDGRRVARPGKGMVIVNGRKVVGM